MNFKNKQFYIYFLSNSISFSIPILIVPILTNYIIPEHYALIALYRIYSALITTGITKNIIKKWDIEYSKKESDFQFSKVFNSLNFIFGALIVIIFSIVFIFGHSIISITKIPLSLIFLLIISSIFAYFFRCYYNYLRFNNKSIAFLSIRSLESIINFGSSLFFVTYLLMDWKGRIYGILISSFLSGLISIFFLMKFNIYKLNFDLSLLKSNIKFLYLLFLSSIFTFGIAFSDRLLITYFFDLKTLGIYSIGLQLAIIISILADSLYNYCQPLILKSIHKKDFVQISRLNSFSILSIFLFFGLTLVIYITLNNFGHIFINKAYKNYETYFLLISISNSFAFSTNIKQNIILFFNKSKIIFFIEKGSFFINIGFSFVLLKSLGTIGIPLGLLISTIFRNILLSLFSNKLLKEYQIKSMNPSNKN